MMDEIASHIIDIVANSVTAKATYIIVEITSNTNKDLLSLYIKDDGLGMDEEMAYKVQDPFFSTKIGKKVGLGIPLLKGTAETTGGIFRLSSVIGKGTEIFASFDLTHPDLPPLGNIRDTMLDLDTKEIKHLLDGVPINHPDVITFLSKYLDENM
jgi:signal transduction histidine kinase